VFDYVEGGADEELSLAWNLAAFRRRQFVPINPRDVTDVDASSTLFERRVALPLICSPTGYTRMMHPAGEAAVARAGARAGIPYVLSSVASSSIEELADTGHPDLWFQLYVWRDRAMTHELVERAWAAGYRVLEVSVDAPVAGNRIRDVRNGLTIPPRLTPRTLFEIALKPSYWLGVLRSPPISFANSPAGTGVGGGITIENMTSLFEPGLSWDDVAALRERWAGALVVKGSLDAAGAREAVAAGADGVHLSNHGGRQLDRVVPPIELVAEVREAVGDEVTIVVDSGIRSGADLAVAIALGADAGAIGRAYLYGLMAGGEPGVDRALALIRGEFVRTLGLLGVSSVAELRACGGRVLRDAATAAPYLDRR
jgi:L-lactate dehydrogenase (cytochrome)